MQVVHPICRGIDVHQAQLTACLRRVDTDGQVTQEVREFATTDDALLTLSTWLTGEQCPVVALESTGVHWRPVYHVLVGMVEVLVGHAQEMRRRPGHKTDKADARWIAELLAHGLIRPSVIPPPPIQALRDLTHTRVALIQTRTQAKNRVIKVLEDTNIKLTSVVSDLFGRSGRRMLAALLAGERDPKTLAALALGGLRRQQSQLELALTGQLTEHHAWLIQGTLELIDRLDRQLDPGAHVHAERPHRRDRRADVVRAQPAGEEHRARRGLDDPPAQRPVVDAPGAAQDPDRRVRLAGIEQQRVGMRGRGDAPPPRTPRPRRGSPAPA